MNNTTPSISWQHRIQQLRETYLKSRSLAKSLWYVFLPLFLSSLGFSLLKLLSIAGVFDDSGAAPGAQEEDLSWELRIWVMFAVYTTFYVLLSITFYRIMRDLLRVWGTPYFEEMIGWWVKLQKAETNELLKKRLAE